MPAACHLICCLFGALFFALFGTCWRIPGECPELQGWRRQQLVFGAGVGCIGRSFFGSRNLHSQEAIMEDQLSLRRMF